MEVINLISAQLNASDLGTSSSKRFRAARENIGGKKIGLLGNKKQSLFPVPRIND